MFQRLPASIPTRERHPISATLATVAHASCIVGLALAGREAVVDVSPTVPDTIPIAEYPRRPLPPVPDDVPGGDGIWSGDDFDLNIDVPRTIPPFDSSRRIPGPPVRRSGTVGRGLFDSGRVYDGPIAAAVADEPPLWLAGPALHYPDILRSAGLEGEVEIEVVIGPDGRPDAATLTVLRATHPRFVDAARGAILNSIYRPGRLNGVPVAVVIRQTVRFSLR